VNAKTDKISDSFLMRTVDEFCPVSATLNIHSFRAARNLSASIAAAQPAPAAVMAWR
jgi:hypothetical protein